MGKDSFILYDAYDEQISFLTDEQAGVLLKALYAHRKGKPLPDMDMAVNMAFSFIRSQLDRDQGRYDDICETRKNAGKAGAAKRWGNHDDIANDSKNSKCYQMIANDSKNSKRWQKVASVADNEYEYDNEYDNEYEDDNDNKKKSTSVLKEKGRSDEHQKLFFEKYPLVVIDNYSTADYADMDFELLILEFEQSKFLQGRKSFKWICSNYRAIVAGHYRDFVDGTDNASKKKPLYATPTVYSCED